LLPQEWLAESKKIGELMTRTMLDVYSADPKNLASIVDNYLQSHMAESKQKAFQIGYDNFSYEILQDKYEQLFKNLK
jgi:hypothetical protein